MRKRQKRQLDFGETNIHILFINLLIPTLMGMISNSILNIIDGIIVGKGVSSDALAAVNVSAALYVVASAIGMMFASGVSIVAAMQLAKKENNKASVNMTQSMVIPSIFMSFISLIMIFCTRELNYIFGGSEKLYPLVRDYIVYIFSMPVLYVLQIIGTFMIRLDGSPKFSMTINFIPAIVNCFLDYAFVFILKMGIKGAAIATSISYLVGVLLVIIYFEKYSTAIRFIFNLKGWQKNLLKMIKYGMPTFIAEIAGAIMIIIGNHMFMSILHEDGVAAFSVSCYLFPLVFMFGNGIAQSQLPIISYNKGLGNNTRIRKTIQISLNSGLILGTLISILGWTFCDELMTLFLDKGSNAYNIATSGFPYFSISFFFYTMNLVIIGVYQSRGDSHIATLFTMLRSVLILIPCFYLIPKIFGEKGLWLAVSFSEAITLIIIILRGARVKAQSYIRSYLD